MRFFNNILQPKYLFAIVLVTYVWFGMQHLTQFMTADENYWIYERVPRYWNAIAEGEWKKTFINDKPGVSVALVSGVGLFFFPQPDQLFFEAPDRTLHYDTATIEPLLLAFRLPLLITNGILLLLLFWIIGRLSTPWIALWSTMLMALSPILLGISQIVNPDALLWSLGTVALFSYCAFLQHNEKKFFVLTSIFTGLAILTKYVAFVLLPFYLALAVLQFLSSPAQPNSQKFRQDVLLWFQISFLSLAFACLFLPALFFDSKYIVELFMTIPHKGVFALVGGGVLFLLIIDTFFYNNTFLLSLRRFSAPPHIIRRSIAVLFLLLFVGLILVRNVFPDWSIFTQIAFDIKDLSDARYHASVPNFFEAFVLEWNPLIFSLTPIALIALFTLLITSLRKKDREASFLSNSLLLFSILYVVLLIFSNILTTPRYSILLYPLFAFLAAIGIQRGVELFPHRVASLLATLVIFIASIASLSTIKPFYFNYTNFLLPKSALINDAWGYGGYEAAQYLNNLPNAHNLTVWIDYYGVCEFFVGRCLNAYTFDKNAVQPDYYVLTRRGKMRYMSRHTRWERLSGLTAYKYYAVPDPEWQLFIGNRPGNFVKVVKVQSP